MTLEERISLVLDGLRARYRADFEQSYLSFHEPRYRFLLAKLVGLVEKLRKGGEEPVRILDVGAAFEAAALRELVPDAVVDTFGFPDGRFPHREHERHVAFDLNRAGNRSEWPQLGGGYDIVVCAEVIEHLYVAPIHALRLLRTALRSGGVLLLQTPNPVHLENRIAIVRGRNPFQQIREDPTDQGHFREYTVRELRRLARDAGFEVVEWQTANYFRPAAGRHRLVATVGPLLPPKLRTGITMLLAKRPAREGVV